MRRTSSKSNDPHWNYISSSCLQNLNVRIGNKLNNEGHIKGWASRRKTIIRTKVINSMKDKRLIHFQRAIGR